MVGGGEGGGWGVGGLGGGGWGGAGVIHLVFVRKLCHDGSCWLFCDFQVDGTEFGSTIEGTASMQRHKQLSFFLCYLGEIIFTFD